MDNNTKETLEYYNRNAISFVHGTIDVDFREMQDEFLSRVKPAGIILDLGCGSGRDSKYFLNQGYEVVAVDGSEEICKIASEYTGLCVIHSTFQHYRPDKKFDGIWACASLLHLSFDEVVEVMNRLSLCLNKGGCFYLSFKYGEFSDMRHGRYFTDMTKETFAQLLANVEGLKIELQKITSDVRSDRVDEKWLNVYMAKV